MVRKSSSDHTVYQTGIIHYGIRGVPGVNASGVMRYRERRAEKEIESGVVDVPKSISTTSTWLQIGSLENIGVGVVFFEVQS